MEVDSGWSDFVYSEGLVPSEGLTPSTTLVPNANISSLVSQARDDTIVKEGLYSRKIIADNYAGMITTDNISLPSGNKIIRVFLYPINTTKVKIVITDNLENVLEENIFSDLIGEEWNFKHFISSIAAGDYKIGIVNGTTDLDNSKTFYVDDLSITLED